MGGQEESAAGHESSMASAMEKLGPSCTQDETSFQEFLKTVSAPTEHTVAEVIAMITSNSEKGKPGWNVTVLVDGLVVANPALDWHHVAGQLDVPGFHVPDAAALEMLMRIWRQAVSDTFPLSSLVGGLWKNAEGQLSFLRQATRAEPEVFSWAHAERRQEAIDGLTNDKSSIGTSNSCWLCLDLYSTLAALAASGYEEDVRGILEHPLKVCPEVFLLGAATVEGDWGPLQADVDALCSSYLQTNSNSGVVLKRLWPQNRDLVLKCMVNMQSKEPTSVARLLDVCQELRALSEVLEATAAPFCLELAALAARREYLNLEKWLCDQFTTRGVSFMQASVSFLDAKLREDVPPSTHGSPARLGISVETLAVFLRVLAANAGEVPTDTLQQLKLVQAVAVQAHPELATVIAEAGVMEAFPQDVEEEANAAFQKMYQGELTVDDVISLLLRYKSGMEAREQDVYACMVHNLFDEFRFFYKYPEQELKTTALLFGKLISHKLVSSVSLGIAMRYIHDSLKNEVSHKLFMFGITASVQFKDSLDQFPTFAQQLANHPVLKEASPELFKAATLAVAKLSKEQHATAVSAPQTAAQAEPVARPEDAAMNGAAFQTAMPNAPATPNLLFSTINAETLEQAAQANECPAPEAKTVDKVHFYVNNLTSTNVDVKAKELAGVVTSEYYPWFANYLVVKRAAQEPNFHPVYVLLVDKWGDKVLRQILVSITVHYCKVMLHSKLLKSNSSERTLLKNLGAWLGKLTLGCNKPVLQKHLDIKQTILSAYSQGMMLPILSFVRNLMEPCATSIAFKPPNPWTMAILALLVEIYNLDGIRTSIKFEVELLFKQMDLLVSDVEPSTLIQGLPRDTDNNMDFAAAKVSASPQPASRTGDGSEQTQPAPALDPSVIASLPNMAVINPQLSMVGERLELKSLLVMSLERALVEIIAPVVERSVTIACMTCQQLVSKDFAFENDADIVRKAANTSVTGLAQSLALVTAREPLRIAVTNNLRSLLAQRLEPSALEQVVTLLVSDNLDICCQIIEKAAGKRSQQELDERMAQSYAARTKARATGQMFRDKAFADNRFIDALPEALKAKPGALTPQQQKVYQDFAAIPRTAASAQQQAASGRPITSETGGMDDAQQAQVRSRFIAWIQRMEGTLARANSLGAKTLNDPSAADLKLVVSDVASVPASEIQAIEVAKNIFFSKLYQSPSGGKLSCCAYAGSLVALRDKVARTLPSEAALWFAQLPDDVRGLKDSGEALIRTGLIPMRDIDTVIAKSLNAPRYQPAAELLLGLLQTCVLGSDPCFSTADIPASLDILAKLAARVNGGQGVLALINQARQVSSARGAAQPPSAQIPAIARPQDAPHLVPSVMKAFDQWARLLEENPADKKQNAFVKSLRDSGLLGDDDTNDKFFRIMTQLAVTHCLRSETQIAQGRPGNFNFVAIDAHVRLMVTLVVHHGGGKDMLSKILGAVATCLFQMAEDRSSGLSGRPFFRIIVGLLAELSPLESVDETGCEYLQVIAGFLYATRPQRVPSFAFPWLQLMSDRRFMPPLLMIPDQSGWPTYIQLLLSQMQFLEPFLKHAELTDVIRLLYKGTLRLLLVLLHDFPEFLGQYHFRLCDAIPVSCVQMRNLILSAFPRKMRLPDPFTTDLKLNTLPEVQYHPRTSPPMEKLLPEDVANEIDMFIAGTKPIVTVKELLKQRMAGKGDSPGAYHIPSVNAIVLYIGLKGLQSQRDGPQKPAHVAGFNTPAIQLYAALLKDLDPEGRCLLVNAMANQLRYPNAHTQYFYFAVLHLFESANDEKIQEHITRVLLERLIANRPHPWGLLITFIELIKNPEYDLLNHSFTKVAPEIERLFESVARSCTSSGSKSDFSGQT